MPGLIKHSFDLTTYSKPTYCNVCSHLLWGLVRQGYQCSVCKCNAHKACQSQILVSCPGKKSRVSSPQSPDKSFIREIVDSSHSTEDPFVDLKTPLNLLTTTPKNFSRFVGRVGYLVAFQDELIHVLNWENPGKTMAYLLGWCFLCLYPIFFTILPQICLLYVIIKNYIHPVSKHTMSEAQLYTQNMKFIQNHMGLGSDLYDNLALHYKVLEWKDEQETINFLNYLLLSCVGVYITVYLIPFNLIAMMAGVVLFLKNTTFFRVISLAIPQVLFSRINKKIHDQFSRNSSKDDGRMDVWENQRWWAGLGWMPYLIKAERSCWSDASGTIAYCHINEIKGDWVDDSWSINETWTNEGFDEQGWQYSDNAWQGVKGKCGMGSFTRRRCWSRRAKVKCCADVQIKEE